MIKSNYYKWTTYRRKMLDLLQERYKYLYKGIVLDIGGRDRGNFIKPKENVKKWIFADINELYKPDIILDVENMKEIDSNSMDVVNAIELFEHVKNIQAGLEECCRVLKKGGIFIISTPFLFHIHADPYDFQRWTATKWKYELKKIGLRIEKFIIMGKYFTLLSENLKSLLETIERNYSLIGKILYWIFSPILDRILRLDKKSFVLNDPKLNYYHNGYFIITKK